MSKFSSLSDLLSNESRDLLFMAKYNLTDKFKNLTVLEHIINESL